MRYNLTSHRGIDYARLDPTVNRNPETGIRYGVIPTHVLAWWDEAEPIYPEPSCGECGVDATETNGGYRCDQCDRDLDDSDFDCIDPIGWVVDTPEVRMEQFGDSSDVFVTRSRYVTFAQFCSPCAPGACYLLNPVSVDGPGESNRCYCPGPGWFDDGNPAPYPIWDAVTGKAVKG